MLIIQSTMSVKSSFLLVKSPSSVKSLFYRGQNNVMSTTHEVGMLSTIYRCLNKFMVMTFMGCLDNFFWFYHVLPTPMTESIHGAGKPQPRSGILEKIQVGVLPYWLYKGCPNIPLLAHGLMERYEGFEPWFTLW